MGHLRPVLATRYPTDRAHSEFPDSFSRHLGKDGGFEGTGKCLALRAPRLSITTICPGLREGVLDLLDVSLEDHHQGLAPSTAAPARSSSTKGKTI
jgi:hypothetical protein